MKATQRSNDREALVRDAKQLVIVDDGAYRWAGDRAEVYAWLDAQEISRGHDRSYNTPNSATMDSDQYQELCDSTTCYVDTSGSYGPSGIDPHELIDEITEAGAPTLYIH
jgi:hypothetical protein